MYVFYLKGVMEWNLKTNRDIKDHLLQLGAGA
jgi:hypothetical protein